MAVIMKCPKCKELQEKDEYMLMRTYRDLDGREVTKYLCDKCGKIVKMPHRR